MQQNGDAKRRDSAKNELKKSVRMVRQGIRRKDRQNQDFGFLSRSVRNGDFLAIYKQSCLRRNSKAKALTPSSASG